jgi:hypothetical protein
VFSQESGLIDSGLSGIEGNIISGDADNKGDDDDLSTGSPPVFRECDDTKGGEEKNEEKENDEEEVLADALGGLTYFTEEEMKIDTFFQPLVPLSGQGITARHRGLPMITVDLPHGAVLQSIDISIDPQDNNKGFVHVDIIPSLSVPETTFQQSWIDPSEGNPILAEIFVNQLQSRLESDAVPGSMLIYWP